MRMSTESEGTRFAIDLTREGDTIRGVRTITYADGRTETEPLTLAADELSAPSAMTLQSESALDGLEVVSATPTANGTAYELVTAAGVPITLEVEGDADYPLPAAAAIILALTPAFVIAVCGVVLYYSIKRCADANRCWSVGIKWYNPASICTGSCKVC